MANVGLKSYTKQLTQEMGKIAKIHVNLNQDDGNLIFTIPLMSSVGLNPIETSLIFNYQNKSETGLFGNGMRLNFYTNLTGTAFSKFLKNPDGTTDTYYAADSFKNEETQIQISEEWDDPYQTSSHYEIVDKYSNIVYYKSGDYPYRISKKDGYSYLLDFTSVAKTINNGQGDVIKFTKSGDYINLVEYYHDNSLVYYAELTYNSNGYLTKIIWKNGSTTCANLEISYSTSNIVVKDSISGYRIKYNLSGNKVTSYKDGYGILYTGGHTVNIAYDSYRTTVTNYLGHKMYYFFDSNGLPLYEYGSDGYVIETEYNRKDKSLLSCSGKVQVKYKDANLFPESIAYFTANNVLVTPVSVDSFFEPILGTTAYQVTASNGGSLSYLINVDGIATDDVLAVIWGKQLTAKTDNSYVWVKLEADGYSQNIFKKEVVDDYFNLMTLGLSAKKAYSTIKLTIYFYGTASIILGGVQVIRKPFNAFYNYDTNKNITQIGSGGKMGNLEYGVNNLPSRSISKDSSMYKYTYDTYNNLTNVKSAYGVEINNTYDSTYKTNLLTSEITNKDGTKILRTEKTYVNTNGRFVDKEIDELGNETSYSYDAFGRVTSLTNALGTIYTTAYNNNGTINQKSVAYGSESETANYTYDSEKKLTGISASNGSTHSFTYDAKDNITNISLNNRTIFKYTYDSNTQNILTQRNGTNGDGYNYEYGTGEDKYLLMKTYYVDTAGTSSLRYQYTYNNRKQLIKVSDGSDTTLTEYQYDSDGRLIKSFNDDVEISRSYDNLGNVNLKSIAKTNSSTINQTFDSVERSKGANPEALLDFYGQYSQFLLCQFTNDNKIRGYGTSISPTYHASEVARGLDGVIPYASIDSGHTLSYQLTMPQQYPLDSGCIQFWFKSSAIPSQIDPYLFTLRSNGGVDIIKVHFHGLKIMVDVVDQNNVSHSIFESDYEAISGDWNFFALSFINRYDGTGTPDICEYALNLNGHMEIFTQQNPRIYTAIGTNCWYNIGHIYNGTSDCFNGKIACLYVGANCYAKTEEIKKYYRLTKDYFIDNQLVDSDVETVDFAQTHLLTISSTNQNIFDIFPLQNGVTSLKGTKPVIFDLREISVADKDGTFNFNKLTKNYAYVADGTDLAYQCLGSNGTIAMRAYTDSIEDRQYLFEGKDANNYTVGLYRGSNLKLYFEVAGTAIDTGITFTTNVWHNVALTYKFEVRDVGGFSIPYTIFRLRVDNNTYSYENVGSHVFYNIVFHIGRKIVGVERTQNIGSIMDYYPLLGQIEMLCISNTYQTDAVLQSLLNELGGVSKIKEYDELGMLKKIDIHKTGSSILSNSLNYKSRTNSPTYISKIVSSEVIKLNGTNLTTRTYTTDAIGNVIGITDSIFGSHTYEYDYRGFLSKDDSTTIEYYGNGNIKKYGSTDFAYDTTIKDRLIQVGTKTISYSSNNLCNPTSYDGKTFEYEGRRLTKLTLANSVYYNYTYNEKGLRISKTSSNGLNIKYLYDGDKLVSQQSSNESLDFLYDESGYLYGFIHNNSTRYYYVRDVLHNILGIVNESGSLVVKYAYNAYGVIQSITGSLASTIGVINPFRYKGYYYDNESSMYYCKSRYYVPEWCRWLNNDAALYTQTNSYYSNAFVYCNNNPISNIDENGNFVITLWVAVLIAAGIGFIIGGSLGAISAVAKGEDVVNGAIFGGIVGALIGAVAVFGGGIVAGGFTIFGTVVAANSAAAYITAGVISTICGGIIGGGAEMVHQWIDYGEVKDWSKVGKNALIYGVTSGLFSLVALPTSVAGFVVGTTIFNIQSSSISLIIDLIISYYKKQRESVYEE